MKKIAEHGSTLSRQQRARQARVDVNLNYASSNSSSTSGHNQQQTSSKIRLIEDDFPSINGSTTAVPLVTHRMQSLQLSGREEWPSLGEGRSSPSSSATTPEPSKPTIISRQAAALDRVADTLRNLDKMLQFRKYINQYTKEMTLTSEAFVDSVHELCNKDMKLTSRVLEHTKDMIDHDLQKADLERVWNHKKNPVWLINLYEMLAYTSVAIECSTSSTHSEPKEAQGIQ